MPQPGIDQLKHIVVLMMENRSFDHLLGYMMAQDARIDGVDGTQTNPDTTGALAPVQPLAQYQSQLQPDPGHHYPDVDLQIFGDPRAAAPNMQGFIKAYYQKQNNVSHSHNIMYCFPPEKVPVITTLASNFLLFNRWFSSLPGPTIPNRAFAHFGTSFGKTDMDLFYLGQKYKTIYERMVAEGHTAKIYYYDPPSATLGMTFILKDQPALFGQFDQFQAPSACNWSHRPFSASSTSFRRTAPRAIFRTTASSNRTTPTIPSAMALCRPPTSIPITMCWPEKSSSLRSTCPSSTMRTCGTAPCC